MELPEIVAGVPAMAWIAPNAIPEPAPTIGIAIGTPVSDIVPGDVLPGDVLPGDVLPSDVLPGDVMLGDVVRIAGVVRVGLTCANVELLPNKTRAAAMRAKLRIGTSCV
jgi:hypothetical protein